MAKKYEDYNADDWVAQAKADEFDALYAASQAAGNAKEQSGEYRPEPGHADREPKGKW